MISNKIIRNTFLALFLMTFSAYSQNIEENKVVEDIIKEANEGNKSKINYLL